MVGLELVVGLRELEQQQLGLEQPK